MAPCHANRFTSLSRGLFKVKENSICIGPAIALVNEYLRVLVRLGGCGWKRCVGGSRAVRRGQGGAEGMGGKQMRCGFGSKRAAAISVRLRPSSACAYRSIALRAERPHPRQACLAFSNPPAAETKSAPRSPQGAGKLTPGLLSLRKHTLVFWMRTRAACSRVAVRRAGRVSGGRASPRAVSPGGRTCGEPLAGGAARRS